jgi:putative tricarboxylic transport membrane protein
MKVLGTAMALSMTFAAAAAHGQTWSPQKNVEIVVGSAPGGSNDKTARTVERIMVMNKLVPTSVTVVNKPGGGDGFRKDLDRDYAAMKAVLVDLGLATAGGSQ